MSSSSGFLVLRGLVSWSPWSPSGTLSPLVAGFWVPSSSSQPPKQVCPYDDMLLGWQESVSGYHAPDSGEGLRFYGLRVLGLLGFSGVVGI